jgi:ribosomal protein L11 methyltransferase
VNDWQIIIDWRGLGKTDRELLIGELWCHEISGIEEREDDAVVGFTSDVAARSAAAEIGTLALDVTLSLVEVVNDAYLDEWRAYARPWRVDALFVRPSWVDAAAPADTIEIVIDPQRSFGSGAHASTRLALELLQRIEVRGRTVLDVGCGSGVLSVAAAVLGAARVEAIDVELDAVEATMANARRNRVDDRIRARVTPIAGLDGHFDIVLANVLPSVHREIADDVRHRAWPFAIAAGMLKGQTTEIESAYGATKVASLTEDHWIALLLQVDRSDGGS